MTAIQTPLINLDETNYGYPLKVDRTHKADRVPTFGNDMHRCADTVLGRNALAIGLQVHPGRSAVPCTEIIDP